MLGDAFPISPTSLLTSYPLYLLKEPVVRQVGSELQMQIPASRKTALTALIFDFFSCSELCFKQVAGSEVSERIGIAEKQSELPQSWLAERKLSFEREGQKSCCKPTA